MGICLMYVVHRPCCNYPRRYCVDIFQTQLLLPMGHTCTHFFQFLKRCIFQILTIFVNMGPYWSKHFKKLLLPQTGFEVFQTSSEFSSQWSSQEYSVDFLNFKLPIFHIFFETFEFTIVPYGETKTSIIWKATDRRAKCNEL